MINNSFNPQANFSYGDNVALRVRVRNTGDSFRNNWSTRTYFYDMNGIYRSVVTDNELPLNSNGEVTLIIQTNNQINRGNTLFNFSLDTNNNVYESNENDNTANVSAWVY
jgi:subtilase family serine protease